MPAELPRTPASDLATLQAQLTGTLRQLERDEGGEPEVWRAYLLRVLELCFRDMSRGNTGVLKAALDVLAPAMGFAERHRPRELSPKAAAALELGAVWEYLEEAERVAEESRREAALRDVTLSRTEHAVLRALQALPTERFARRSEVHRAVREGGLDVSPQAVGQALEALYEAQLLVRSLRRAQGASEVGFYALSEKGRAFCREELARRAPARAAASAVKAAPDERAPVIPTVERVRPGLGERELLARLTPEQRTGFVLGVALQSVDWAVSRSLATLGDTARPKQEKARAPKRRAAHRWGPARQAR